jgi:hypothetical protein
MVEKARTNSKSVASLTLGILSIIIPTIGLVLGIIGIGIVISRMSKREIEKTNENGRGLATSGNVSNFYLNFITSSEIQINNAKGGRNPLI